MKALRIHFTKIMVSVLLIAMVLMFIGTPKIAAQGPMPECASQGAISADCKSQSPGTVNAQTGAYFSKALSVTLKGGYVAHGVGMRNTGSGTIVVTDVPTGSTVSKAYLLWAVMGPAKMPGFFYNKGYLNGVSVTGSLVGTNPPPCWGPDPIWSYRADVTKKMSKGGNSTYYLSGFASGRTDGADPWTYVSPTPMLDGASLVIVYKQTNGPLTTVQIYNGAATSVYNQIHLNMPGVNALGMKGLAYTTFIGADGQSDYSQTGSTFFTSALPTVGWSGSDPNGRGTDFSRGNLWDTSTVNVRTLFDTPEPDFWASTSGALGYSADCLTWVGQVVSYSTGNQDSDGDKLLDGWELDNYGLAGMGANPLHKDLFVEADYMSNSALPDLAHLNDIVAVFNNAPVANPDGTTGIHLHIDTGGAAYGSGPGTYPAYDLGGGNAVPFQTYLGADTPGCATYDWTQFQGLKNTYFYSGRAPIFHYMIFANDLAPCMGTTSGISRNGSPDSVFITGATDFIVSLGGWGTPYGTQIQREGTFVHEFGHNLGLRHGGNDHVNYKPNYLSVMNYLYQTIGLWRDGGVHIDYSRILNPSLNENKLNEVNGLGTAAANYGIMWFCPGGGLNLDYTAGDHVDWNCNGDGGIQTNVKVDINGDAWRYPYVPVYSTLGTQNNWASITFQGGGVIGSGMSAAGLSESLGITSWVDELTYEQAQLIGDYTK